MKLSYTPRCNALVIAFFFVLFIGHNGVMAQGVRTLGAEAISLDNASGGHFTILPPTGLTTNYTFVFPPPPSLPGLSAAFIGSAHATGDIAVWDGSEWVWGNAVSSAWMGGSPPFAFAFTFNEHAGPSSNGLLDLGDASHHFRTLYVDNIVGASVGLGPVLSGDASGPQGSTAVIALRGTPIATTAPTSMQALVYSGSQWTPTNVVNSISTSSGLQLSAATGDVALSLTTIPIANGGTGATTAAAAIANLLPTQAGNAGRVLQTDGSTLSWQTAGGNGTVTSLGVSGGTTGLTTSGGPITTSGTITLGGTLAISNGGTGATTAPTALNNLLPSQVTNAGKVLTTDGANATWTTPASAGVTSVNVSGGTTGLSTSGGPITTGGTITLGGTLAVANGGTGATTASSALNNLLPTQSGNGGRMLQTDGSNAAWVLPTNGTVTSLGVSGGTTGLTTSGGPITTSGTITLGGTLAVANGGTGATTASSALNNLLPSQATNAGKVLTTDGSNATWTTPASAGVTSVNVSGGTTGLTTSGGPITTSGTITLGGTLAVANGGTGAAIASEAINNLLPLQSGNGGKMLQTDGSNVSWQNVPSAGVTSVDVSGGTTGLTTTGGPITTSGSITLGGILAVANGGTGATTQIGAINNLLPTQAGNATKVLQTDGTNVSWQTVSGGGGGWGLSGNAISDGEFLGTTNGQDLIVKTSGTERMRILSSGNVGIGTNNAAELLEVKDGNVLLSRTGANASQLQLQGTGTGATTISAGAQGSTAISYTLPTVQGAANSVLSNDGSGNMSWTNIGQTSFARKTSDQNFTVAAMVNDADLALAVAANATYTFDALLSVSDPNVGGVTYEFTFTSPTGSTIKWGLNDATAPASTGATIINASGTATRVLSLNGTKEIFILVKGILITGANSGTLQLREEKFGGGLPADPVRFHANSYLQMTRVQ